MIKNILIILILVFGFSFSEVSHSRLTGTNIHTVYRWQFADSAARVNQSVSAADTMKLAYQRSDSTSWILVSTTGSRWKKVAYASNQNTLTTSTMTLDSLKLTKGINATGGTFSGALTGATLNTGYGANELHPMNQGVRTTDDVTFDSTRTRVSVFDSVKLGTGSFLKTYAEGSFPCTLKTSDVTVQQVGTINYTIIGNVVYLTFPFIYGTSNSTQLRLYCGGLTGLLDAGRVVCYDVPFITDNAVSYPGTVTYMYGLGNYFAFIKKDNTSFTSSGNKGIGGWLPTNKTTITYTK